MLETEVKRHAAEAIRQSRVRICRCLDLLEPEEIWKDFNANLVSVGNLILHLMGNISQHVLSGLGHVAYTRQRDREFSDKPGMGRAELLARLGRITDEAVQVIEGLRTEDLARRYIAQGRECSGAEDLMAVVEHLSYHTGQITFAVKYLKNLDVGYYAGVDLNQQNRSLG
ncbi:MAG TPA: DinB family protein [Candidatus Methylomirabilis sp.]|nr:DinB family protein [Candidatus Methylomirabilis sp.]